MTLPYLLSLPTHGSAAHGWLTVAEAPGLPFEVRRTYWITQVPPAQVRGRHAHHTLEQLLVAAHGTVHLRIRVPGQAEAQAFSLSSPTQALYLPPHCWPEIQFELGAVLLCLASAPYDATDYLHE
ncbi:MAG: sugar 3,4-ketoisomerase [Janthinobacterium lividum]